ncbi:abc transporter permease protein domain [Lucifera butyrica]|uniref:Abc transporter permease protein domain n=1 Tax=Lucifera butyrica TaxID=1351585 RepID=A0A498R4B3_9FIRM|nr:ABC transporter permease [Lucifera butyrica]VBB05112.1 abc transporter permease protein domain [Lucifera butyrica]
MSGYYWFSPRWRKVWSDLGGNKMRTVLVVLSIAVGVFAVGMVYSSYLMFQRDLSVSWRSASPASASLFADPFNEELVQSIRSLRSVKEAEGRRNVNLRVLTADGQWRQMALIAIPDYVKQKVNVVRHIAGAWPPGDGDVLLERSSLKAMGISQGSRILVETSLGHKRSLKVTGVVYDPSQTPSLFSGSFYGYISMDTLAKLDESRRLDQINLVVQPWVLQGQDTAPIAAVGRQAWRKLEQGNTTVSWLQVNKPGEHQMQGAINALLLLLAVLGVLSLMLGTFLLANTVSSILTQQVRQVGIMKSIGAQRDQILRMYLTLVGAYGLLAFVVAVPLGALAARAVTGFMAGMFNFDAGELEVPARVVALELAVAILVPLAAALWPVWRGTGITVREALTDYGIGGVEAQGRLDHWVDRGLERLRGLPRPVLLSLRNTFRRKGRLALTLLTLTVAGTVFMAVFSVRSSLYSTLDQALDYFHYDISVELAQSYQKNRIDQELLQVPGVKAVECWGRTSGRVLADDRPEAKTEASKNVFILAPPPDTRMIQPRVIAGRWLLPGDESALVVNTTMLKDSPQLKVGGPAFIMVGDRKLRFTVVGIVQGILTGPIVYAPYQWLTGAVQEAGRARSVQVITDSAAPLEQSSIGRNLEEHLKKDGLRVQNVEITWEQKKRIRSQFDIITVFLLLMAVLLAVVGALGLTGAMGINVLERTREIGVMRAIGASSLDIGKVFLVEALCTGFLSWLLGTILALPVAFLLSRQVGVLFLQNPLEFSFSFLGVGIWLGLSALLSVLASLLPARNAARISVRSALNYE